MTRSACIALATSAALLLPATVSGQAKHYPLESTVGLRPLNVTAEPATLKGKKGLRVTVSDEFQRRMPSMTEEQRNQLQLQQLVVIEGLEFSSGIIEAEIAGEPAPGAAEGARGFVGIAFRMQPEVKTYDAFYIRPTNGRVEDQERRNHATQYISEPVWPWARLRAETPSKYEAYVDLVPGEWTKIKIEVRGQRARLYVHGSEHPTLVVNDVKSGATSKGAVALWIGPGTIAHFRSLTVMPEI